MFVSSILFYLCVGAFLALGFSKSLKVMKAKKENLRYGIFYMLSVVSIALGVAWAYTSNQEGEYSAAVSGLLLFGGIGIALGLFSYWKMNSDSDDNKRAESSTEKKPVTPLQIVAIVLISLCVLSAPVTILLKGVTSVVSDKERVTTVLDDTAMSNEALPRIIKKSLMYQALYTPFETPLEPRMMVNVFSGISAANWVRGVDIFMPEEVRMSHLDRFLTTFYTWLDSEAVYPNIAFTMDNHLERLQVIKGRTTEMASWFYSAVPMPPCSPEQIEDLKSGKHNNDLKEMIGCSPPEEMRSKLAPVTGTLIQATLDELPLPQNIDINKMLQEKVTVAKITEVKSKINTLFSVGSVLWIIPMLFLFAGLALVVRSLESFARWTSWPLTALGLVCTVGLVKLPKLELFYTFPKELPKDMPAPGLALIQELGIHIARQVNSSLIVPAVATLMIGFILLIVSYRKSLMAASLFIKDKSLDWAGQMKLKTGE